MKLYTYFRSSAAFRVRIALALKGLDYESIPVHLLRNGGAQHQEDFRAINPLGLVPALEDTGPAITQSLAIIEYLDETWPEPPLLPGSAHDRACIRALALGIACDIHPLNNLRVLRYLTGTLGVSDEVKDAWYRHWVDLGFAALETTLATQAATGVFCFGDSPTLADCCLVPQVANARRMGLPLDAYPTVMRIESSCLALPAFQRALPQAQPDAE